MVLTHIAKPWNELQVACDVLPAERVGAELAAVQTCAPLATLVTVVPRTDPLPYSVEKKVQVEDVRKLDLITINI